MFGRFKARGSIRSRRKPGEMTRPEVAYEAHLQSRHRTGEVAWYGYERTKLKLADNTFFSPDFTLLLADGTIEHHEVKGRKNRKEGGDTFWCEEDAKLKIKVAAEQHPYVFCIVWQNRDGSWGRQEF